MKLIFDEMLRNTARWSRMAGIDSQIFEGGGDDRLAALAQGSGRTIVTRDRALAAKCKKQGVRCMLLPAVPLRRQLRIIRQYTGPFRFPAIIRCPLCNATLRRAKKNEVALKVPKKVLKMHRKFWVCGGCGKVYWTGSHWKRIYRILHSLSRPGPAKG